MYMWWGYIIKILDKLDIFEINKSFGKVNKRFKLIWYVWYMIRMNFYVVKVEDSMLFKELYNSIFSVEYVKEVWWLIN